MNEGAAVGSCSDNYVCVNPKFAEIFSSTATEIGPFRAEKMLALILV
jgi:hypothetical protein